MMTAVVVESSMLAVDVGVGAGRLRLDHAWCPTDARVRVRIVSVLLVVLQVQMASRGELLRNLRGMHVHILGLLPHHRLAVV